MCTLPSLLDPRIGILSRAEGIAFYAYDRGYDYEPVKGSLNEVERAIGIPLSSVAPCDQEGLNVTPGKPLRKIVAGEMNKLKRYAVTAIPSVVLYSSGAIIGESVEYVDAVNRSDAIQQVRKRIREVNGRYGPRFTFTAKLSSDT